MDRLQSYKTHFVPGFGLGPALPKNKKAPPPLPAIWPEGPQKKILYNLIINYVIQNFYYHFISTLPSMAGLLNKNKIMREFLNVSLT